MEVTSCVQGVVNAATTYISNPSDNNQVHLQRQLDVLISLSSRSSSLGFFSTKEMLPTECMSYLVDIIDNQGTTSSLAQKIMLLFDNLANKKEIRSALHSTYHLTSSLAKFLKTQTLSAADPNTSLCLKLLHKTTYACKVSFQEAYLDDLMSFLVKHIQEKEDDLTLSSIGLVANLCRNNIPVQMIIKNQEKPKTFYQKLASLLSHKNNRMVIFALSALTSLCLNEDFGEKIFNPRNINQIFQLLFNILMKGDVGTTRRYTVDVFIDLIKHTKIRHALSVYDHLDSCLAEVLTLISQTSGQGDAIAKIFELLLSLCTVNGIRCVICRRLLSSPNSISVDGARSNGRAQMAGSFQAVIHWASQSIDTHCDAPLLAIDFLREVYEEILDQGVLASASPRTEEILAVSKDVLSDPEVGEGTLSRKHAQKLIKTLQLLLVLASDESLRPHVAGVITTEMCVQLIDYQMTNNTVGLKGVRWTPSSDPEDWSEDGVGVVMYTLDLMITLRRHVSNLETRLCNILQDPRLVSFLSQALTSGIRDRVQIVLRVISKGAVLPEFPTTMLGDCISAQIGQQQNHFKSQMSTQDSMITMDSSNNKENFQYDVRKSAKPLTARNERILSDTLLETSVEDLIGRMQSGLELKDARASELISVYEHKLQSLQTKETHLQDLLEAKSLAMSQADRLITQYRCRMARTEAEAQKLRSLLQEWEKRSEDYREQINDMMLEREKMTTEMDQAVQDNARLEVIAEEHQELSELYTEQTQKLENAQRSLSTLKQEHQSLSEMHEMLRRHNDTLKQQYDVASQQLTELEDERKSMSKQLKEKESKVQEVTKNLTKAEKGLRKMTKERDDMEATVDKLREELAKTEGVKKDLQHQVSTLELVCRKNEIALKERETQNQELRQEVEKHNKIAQLIHNITSGKEGGS